MLVRVLVMNASEERVAIHRSPLTTKTTIAHHQSRPNMPDVQRDLQRFLDAKFAFRFACPAAMTKHIMIAIGGQAPVDLVEAVNSPNLRLLYDVWHSAVMGEDMAEVLAGRMHLVAHVQVADLDDRNEPGTGKLDWAKVMQVLRDLGYSGAIGLEYFPTLPMDQSLALTREKLGC